VSAISMVVGDRIPEYSRIWSPNNQFSCYWFQATKPDVETPSFRVAGEIAGTKQILLDTPRPALRFIWSPDSKFLAIENDRTVCSVVIIFRVNAERKRFEQLYSSEQSQSARTDVTFLAWKLDRHKAVIRKAANSRYSNAPVSSANITEEIDL
jgi:hypothetical protein